MHPGRPSHCVEGPLVETGGWWNHHQPPQREEDISGADSDLQGVVKGTEGLSLELWMPRSQARQYWTLRLRGEQIAGRERKAWPWVRAAGVTGWGGQCCRDKHLRPDLRSGLGSRADFRA